MTSLAEFLQEYAPELKGKQLEDFIFLVFKNHQDAILNHDDRIQELEAKVKALEKGGK